MGSTWGSRSFQNREKYLKKGMISCMLFLIEFCIDFGRLLGGFLVDFQCQVEGQVDQKIDHMASCWQVGRNSKKAEKPRENQGFVVSRPSNFEAKFKKKTYPDRSKFKQKFGQHLDPIFNGFWRPTWLQDPPKTRPKSRKIDERWTSKSMKILYVFLRGL